MINRYQLIDLKEQCEHMIVPTKEDWMDVLHVAYLISSQILKEKIFVFLRDDMSMLQSEDNEAVDSINDRFPGMMSDILDSRRLVQVSNPSPLILSFLEKEAASNSEIKLPDARVPLFAAIVVGAALYAYGNVAQIVVLGPIVPIVNVTCVLLMLFAAYYYMKK